MHTQSIAEAFVEARRNWSTVADYPGQRPCSLTEAYAIQDQALSIWQRELGGWKVGKIPPPKSDLLGVDRLAGPVFKDLIRKELVDTVDFPIFADGFAAAEAEFMLRLAPQEGLFPSSPQEAMAWVDEVRIGIEIASSPYPGINDDGPCVTISDHGNNAGLLLGREVPRELWSSLDDIEVTVEVDGDTVGRATTASMLDGPFGAVCFLLNNLEQRGIKLGSGWWVSSGAITGVHEVGPEVDVRATFAGIGQTRVRVISGRTA